MVIGLLVDGVGSLFIDLLIEDEDAKRAAKVALKTTAAGISTATGDVGSAVASGVGAAGELTKAAVKDEAGIAVIDTFSSLANAAGGGVDVGLASPGAQLDPLMAALEGGLKQSGATAVGMGTGAAVGHAIDDEGGAMVGLRFGGGLGGADLFDPGTLNLSATRALVQVGAKGGGGLAAGSIAMAAEGGDAKEQRATFERWSSLGQTAGAGFAKLGRYTLKSSPSAAMPDEPKTAPKADEPKTAPKAEEPAAPKVPDQGLLDRLKVMGKKLDAMGLRDLGSAAAGGTWIVISDADARGRVGDAHANQGRFAVSALALAWSAGPGDAAAKQVAQGVVDLSRDAAKVAVDATDGAEAARKENQNDRAGDAATDRDRERERHLRRRAARVG
jgi:hypothetical protein